MNHYLFELLKEYDNKEFDDFFMEKAFSIMMDYEKRLIPYVNHFNIENREERFLGYYDPYNREIVINRKEVQKEENSSMIKNKKLFILEILRHELEHARNLKTLYERKNTIESKIINYCLKDYVIEKNLFFQNELDDWDLTMFKIHKRMNYEIAPDERLAEIKAWEFIINLIKNQRSSEDLLLAKKMLYNSYRRGYKDNGYYLDAPTYEFLLGTEQFRDYYRLKKIVQKKEYSLQTRATYGLPITYDEYNDKILKKVVLRKRK